jgi:hypothetical protein
MINIFFMIIRGQCSNVQAFWNQRGGDAGIGGNMGLKVLKKILVHALWLNNAANRRNDLV